MHKGKSSTEKAIPQTEDKNAGARVFADRPRTNLLRKPEQKTILYLVARVPGFVSSDMLTLLGLTGSLLVLLSFPGK